MKHARIPLLLALLAAPAGPAAGAGLTGAPVLNTPLGARSSAMGRAFTAVPGDPEALNYNPGGLAFVREPRVSATYMSGLLDGGYGFLAVPVPLGPVVLTPGYLVFDSGPVDLRFSDPAKAARTVTAEYDKVAYLSAAWLPAPGLGVGATVKSASLELAETASAASTFYDIGVLYAAENGLSFGASLLNSGGEIKFEEKGDPAPRTKKLGAAYKFKLNPPNMFDRESDITNCDMLFTADWTRTDREKGFFQGGLEADMIFSGKTVFAVRGGYLAGRDPAGFTLGLGLSWKRWTADFSFTPSGVLDTVTQATVNHRF